jgi:hypothetical protein
MPVEIREPLFLPSALKSSNVCMVEGFLTYVDFILEDVNLGRSLRLSPPEPNP